MPFSIQPHPLFHYKKAVALNEVPQKLDFSPTFGGTTKPLFFLIQILPNFSE